ncbi:MAG: HAD family hydrolase [Candidatus Aenigmarchaeota archaeon]|nr:HAD family hydrolase [Candidatus Aenigmarchaeota archaeon]
MICSILLYSSKWRSQVYRLPLTEQEKTLLLKMTPTSVKTLKKLRSMGIITVILSTHPHPPKEAYSILNDKIKHFNLHALFDEVHATTVKKNSKGLFIKRILRKRKIPKSKALMIGDSYHWDYKSAKNIGVDALLVDSHYTKRNYPEAKKVRKTIKKLSDIINYLDS